MIEAESTYSGRSADAPVTRAQAIATMGQAFQSVGLSRTQRDFLLVLLHSTWQDDWEAGRPFSALSNVDLTEALGLSRSHIKNLIRQLAELGFLLCRDGATGRRYRPRHGDDPGSGFDLSPILHRFAELQRAIAARRDALREGKVRRARIFAAKRVALTQLDALQRAELATSDDLALVAEVVRLARLDPSDLDAGILRPRLDRLAEIGAVLTDRVRSIPVESGPQGPSMVAPITTTTPSQSGLVAVAEDDAEGRKAPQVSYRRSAPRQEERKDAGSVGPLAGFDASPAFVRRLSPEIGRMLPQRANQAQVVEAASYVAGELGISQHAWGQACHVLGRYPAAVAVAVIAAKTRAGQIGRPGGYIRALCARHAAGELRLDATLFGLAQQVHPA